jgi:hypothetical protein
MTTTVSPAVADSTTTRTDRSYREIAIGCAVVAGAVHLVVTPQHFAESWVIGAFFAQVTVAQLLLAWLLRGTTSTGMLLTGIWSTTGLICLYVASRTVELPFVPAHGEEAHQVSHLPVAWGVGNGTPVFPHSHVEPVGLPDLVCLMAELGLVVALVGLLAPRVRRHTTNVLLCVGVVAVLLRVSGLLT